MSRATDCHLQAGSLISRTSGNLPVENRNSMNARSAAFIIVGVCVVLAILLLFGVISPMVSGSVFAIALVLLGGTSNGFRKRELKK
jgi:hypothetical protein